MESHTPPIKYQTEQQQIINMTDARETINRTIEYIRIKKDQDSADIKNLQKQLNIFQKHFAELIEKVERLEEDLAIHEDSTDRELTTLSNQIITLNNKFKNFNNTHTQFPLRDNSLSCQKKTIIPELSYEGLQKEQKEQYDLLMASMSMNASINSTTQEKIEKLEEHQALTNKNMTSFSQNIKDLEIAISELKKELSTVTTEHKTHATSLNSYQLSLSDLTTNKSTTENKLASIEKSNENLIAAIAQQEEQISTLQRWLIAFGIGGGSAIALTIWLWYYRHQ